MKQFKPTNDFMFKKIFGVNRNKAILTDLLEAILPDMPIKNVEIKEDVALEKQLLTGKLGILDIVATLNNEIKISIEMQVKDNHNTVERSLFYESGILHGNLDSGDDYIELEGAISIWFTTYDVFEKGPYHEVAILRRRSDNSQLTDKVALHYIQLSKFQKQSKKISNKLEKWLTFIIHKDEEAIAMIKNENVQKAEKELKRLNSDEEARRYAYLREKAIRDEQAAIAGAEKRGREKGHEARSKRGS